MKKNVVFILLAYCFCTNVFAAINMETATFTDKGQTVFVRSSSGFKNPAGFGLQSMFDSDSATCWFEGYQDDRAGRWIDIKYQTKKRIRGLILGLGCRKERLCLEDFSVPIKMSVKLDEKTAIDYSVDWDVKAGLLSPETINMRKTIVWFNSDTAYTSANILLKVNQTFPGRRYINMAVSDFEPIDAFDTRFELLTVLSKPTFNPNDCGTINSPVLFVGNDEPQWITHVIDSLKTNNANLDDKELIEKSLNASTHVITDNNEIVRLIAVLKKQLITDNRMPRYLQDGRVMTYMLYIGTVSFENRHWNIWRYIATSKTSKGLEVRVRYVPFVN